MGAGDYLAGEGPSGSSPIAPPSAARRVTPPDALLFDGASADFPLDANGFYKSSHPIDQKVALALIVRLGSVASVPGLGQGLRNIKRASGQQAISAAKDFVRVALQDMVRAGDIEVVNVAVEYPQRGQIAVAVSYRNLRTIPAQTNTVRQNL